MLVPVLLLVLAIVVLFFGAEFSLDASEKVGKKIGLSPLAIGMLLVGFGTSLPEFFVGHIAGINGKMDIAIGSLVGSNIANMFLILGFCGLFVNMKLDNIKLRHQFIVHFVLGLLLVWVLSQSHLNIYTASPLILLAASYLLLLYKDLKDEKQVYDDDLSDFNPIKEVVKVFFGFGMLYLGGELLVKAGTDLCSILGISEYIVSAIFIAFGTSFPELVTSLLAAYKKKDTDLIIGNIIGSNLFNCALILGSLGIYDFRITANYNFELSFLIAGSFFFILLNLLKIQFNKIIGIFFLLGYGTIVSSWLSLI